MTRRQAARNCEHPAYPNYRTEFGEDPARVLYHLDPTPRIRGIRDPELIRVYLDVETDRKEPRKDVIAQLNQRQQLLRARSKLSEKPTEAIATDGGVA